MLELINRARASPTAEATRNGVALNSGLLPGTISTSRKQPLAFNGRLIEAARGHSRWMLDNGIFSHTGASGSSPSQRAAARGFSLGVSENIERGSSSSPMNQRSGTVQAHKGLFLSSGHRRNLMEPEHSVAGVGLVFAAAGMGAERRTTQNFSSGSTAGSGPFITGVAFSDKNTSAFYDPGEGLRGVSVKPSSGAHYAVTSASGGFAIPIRPVATRPGVVRVDLPFPVNVPGSWEKAKIHERAFRAQQISNAPALNVTLKWSGAYAGLPLTNTLKIKRPELINYRLVGTDGFFFERSMITCRSVKADVVFTKGVPRVIVR